MADDLVTLDGRIIDAMTALRYARAVAQHSANSRTRWQEEVAERALNTLLDQRPRTQMNQQAKALAGATAAHGPGR
jgi:uncharacterized protein (DUF924 family)